MAHTSSVHLNCCVRVQACVAVENSVENKFLMVFLN